MDHIFIELDSPESKLKGILLKPYIEIIFFALIKFPFHQMHNNNKSISKQICQII